MIKRIVEMIALLLLSLPVVATDYYVTPSGGTGSGAKDDPWSLSHANSQLQPGDKVFLRGGTYTNDIISPTRSGTSDSKRIIYQAYPGEVPKFRPSSRTNTPIFLDNKSYITIDGIDADGGGIYKNSKYDHWIYYENTTHTVLKNSKFVRSEGYAAFRFKGDSDYNVILNNVIEYNGTWNVKPWKGEYDDSGSMMWIYPGSDHNLIQGNTISRSGHDLGLIEGNYNVIRQNYYDNFWEVYDGSSFTFKSGDISRGDKVGNRTISLKTGKRNVVEGNVFANVPESVDDSSVGIMKVGGTHQIVRRNYFINQTGQGEGIASSVGSSSVIIQNNRIYNNTFYKVGGPAWWVNSYGSNWPAPKDNVFKNNIIYKARRDPESGNMNAEVSFNKSLSSYHGNPYLNNEVSHNCIALDTNASDQLIYTAAGMQPVANYEASKPTIFFNNIEEHPHFVSTNPVKRDDFALLASSPCIDQAGDLATTSSNGSGTLVKVTDASFFTDGNGVIEGDIINIGSEEVQVKSVNISTNELTIDRNISWNSGAPVNLAVLDNAPDIGAFEFQGNTSSPPSQPTIVNIQVIQ